jgi:hypothetical protein
MSGDAVGLDQYIASGCDGLVGWVTKLGRVIDCRHSVMGAKMLEWMKEDQICTYDTGLGYRQEWRKDE